MRDWTFFERYRGYAIERHPKRKRHPFRVEVPGRDPRLPGGHAESKTAAECRRFVDQALARIAAARERGRDG